MILSKNNIKTPFFIGDTLFYSLEEYKNFLLEDYNSIDEIEDDFQQEVEIAELRKPLSLTLEELKDALYGVFDRQLDEIAISEATCSKFWHNVDTAIQTINIEQVNLLLPSVYFPTEKTFTITKQTLYEI